MTEPAQLPGTIDTFDSAQPGDVRLLESAGTRPIAPHHALSTGASLGRRQSTDPGLDADVEAWFCPDPCRPRIAILGPVEINASGVQPSERRRLYAEILVYLAQSDRCGATADQVDAAIWPDGVNASSRRIAVSKARRWLGRDANGQLWLPPNVGADRVYRIAPGFLLDWHLFKRLRTRGEAGGAAGAVDLRLAMELVRGVPLAGADRPYSSGYRNPYSWLVGSAIQPHTMVVNLVDAAHRLAQLCLLAGDTTGAKWAVERAWLADRERFDDRLWIDAMRIAREDGRTAEVRLLLEDLTAARDVEVPEELAVECYSAITEVMGDLLRGGYPQITGRGDAPSV